MPLDTNLLCQTSAWHNNCGLNGLSNFLAQKLASRELIEYFSSNLNCGVLLDSFQEYYDLPNRPTWEAIGTLFNIYSNPRHREMVFSPVLRHYLGKVILRKAEGLWDFHAAGALTEYLTSERISDIAEPIFYSNEDWFKELKQKYDRVLSEKVRKTASEAEKLRASNEILDQIRNEAKEKWMKEGCQAYANRMSELRYSEMVSGEQLIWIGETLGIGIEIYFGEKTDVPLASSQRMMCWKLKFHNAHVHWKFEEPDKSSIAVRRHNNHYVDCSQPDEVFIKKAIKTAMTKERLESFVFDRTEEIAQASMNQLGDRLECLLQERKITEEQKKEVFVRYFNDFEKEWVFPSLASKDAVDKIAKEINDFVCKENEPEPPLKKRRII